MSLKVWLPLIKDTNNYGLRGDINTPSYNALTQDTSGKIGKCYKGTGLIYNTSANVLGNAWTLATWIKSSGWSSANDIIFCKNVSSSDHCQFYFSIINGASLNLGINAGSSTTSYSYSFGTNTWHHVAATYDGLNYCMYINGALVKSGTCSNAQLSDCTNIGIGCRSTNANGTTQTGGNSTKYLNDARIYDHALSPKEVSEIAKGLVLHYKLDENLNVMNNCYSYPTFNTSAAGGGWNHWGGSGHIGTYGQNTDKNYIFNKSNTYSHWVADGAEATKPYLVYQSPAFEGGYRSIQCIAKEENGLPITESIFYPAWNARDGGTANDKWTSVTALGNGFYLCKCEGVHQDGSNDLIGFNVKPGYKVYISEAYCENDKEICSDIFRTKDLDVVWDCSGYCNNGIANGTMSSSNDTPVYNMSAQFDGTQYLSRATTNAEIKTLSAWFKTTKSKSTSQMICADSASKLCISLYSGTIISYFASGGGHSTGSKCTLGTSYKENDWNHVVVVKTGDGTRDVYCNGVKLTPTTNDYWSQSTGFFVGNRGVGGNIPFYGYISDVRAYATALTENQVLQLYNTPISLANNGTLFAGEFVET